MALISVPPVPVRVHWDRGARQPRRIDWDAAHLDVLALHAVRDERHAYRIDRGPRLTFDLETGRGRIVLSWIPLERRWVLEAVDENAAEGSIAA